MTVQFKLNMAKILEPGVGEEASEQSQAHDREKN
jgi:hypothetical protein